MGLFDGLFGQRTVFGTNVSAEQDAWNREMHRASLVALFAEIRDGAPPENELERSVAGHLRAPIIRARRERMATRRAERRAARRSIGRKG